MPIASPSLAANSFPDYITRCAAATPQIDPYRPCNRLGRKELSERDGASFEFGEVPRGHWIVHRRHEELFFNRIESAARRVIGDLKGVPAQSGAMLPRVLLQRLVLRKPGDQVGLTVIRAGQSTNLTLTIGEAPVQS